MILYKINTVKISEKFQKIHKNKKVIQTLTGFFLKFEALSLSSLLLLLLDKDRRGDSLLLLFLKIVSKSFYILNLNKNYL